MAAKETKPTDPRISAYAKEMAVKGPAGKNEAAPKVSPFNPPRLTKSGTSGKADNSAAGSAMKDLPSQGSAGSRADAAGRDSGAGSTGAANRQFGLATRPPVPSKNTPIIEDGFIKKSAAEKGNNYRKVAKFLVLVGTQEAARIVAKLDEKQVEKISAELATINQIDQHEAEVLLEEFKYLLHSGGWRGYGSGGIETARSLLRTAFGQEKGDAILKKAVPEAVVNPFLFLEDFESDQIRLLLRGESVVTIALVLSRLNPKTAAAVINKMAEEDRLLILKRLAKMQKVAPEVLEKSAETLREKARTIGREKVETIDGRATLAEILKCTNLPVGERLLEELENTDPALGKEIKDRLFTLEDVIRVDDRAIEKKLKTLSDRDIAIILKGRPEDFSKKLLSNVSESRRLYIKDEIAILPPMPKKDLDAAAQAFLAYFRMEKEKGTLILMDDKDVFI